MGLLKQLRMKGGKGRESEELGPHSGGLGNCDGCV